SALPGAGKQSHDQKLYPHPRSPPRTKPRKPQGHASQLKIEESTRLPAMLFHLDHSAFRQRNDDARRVSERHHSRFHRRRRERKQALHPLPDRAELAAPGAAVETRLSERKADCDKGLLSMGARNVHQGAKPAARIQRSFARIAGAILRGCFLVLPLPASAPGAAHQDICKSAIVAVAAEPDAPPIHILTAIARVASGCQPWSFNSQGNPHFFDGELEAYAFLRRQILAGKKPD